MIVLGFPDLIVVLAFMSLFPFGHGWRMAHERRPFFWSRELCSPWTLTWALFAGLCIGMVAERSIRTSPLGAIYRAVDPMLQFCGMLLASWILAAVIRVLVVRLGFGAGRLAAA